MRSPDKFSSWASVASPFVDAGQCSRRSVQRLNETQGHLIAPLLAVVIDRVLSILAREFAGDDRFGFQTESIF